MPFTTEQGYLFIGEDPAELGAPTEMISRPEAGAHEVSPSNSSQQSLVRGPEPVSAYVARLLSGSSS